VDEEAVEEAEIFADVFKLFLMIRSR